MCASQRHSTALPKVALKDVQRANSGPTHCTHHSLACSLQGPENWSHPNTWLIRELLIGLAKTASECLCHLHSQSQPRWSRAKRQEEITSQQVRLHSIWHRIPLFFWFPPWLRTHFSLRTLPILTGSKKVQSPTLTQHQNSLRDDSSSRTISFPQFSTFFFKANLSYNVISNVALTVPFHRETCNQRLMLEFLR